MTDLFAITVDDMIGELEREIATRKRVFPRWVEAKKLSSSEADRRIELLEATVNYLKESVDVLRRAHAGVKASVDALAEIRAKEHPERTWSGSVMT
jgi:hypothetical protein